MAAVLLIRRSDGIWDGIAFPLRPFSGAVGSYDLDCVTLPVTLRKAESGEGYDGIGKDFLDMENMLVLADPDGIFGSSMSDSRRAMVTEHTKNVLVVIYCFEDGIDLDKLLIDAAKAFEKYCVCENMETWICR